MQQAPKTKFRVLIGDTSVRSRMVLSGMIDAEPQLEVVDTAQSKEELLYKAFTSQPDIVVTQTGLTMSGTLPAFQPLYGRESSFLLMVSHELAAWTNPLNRKVKFEMPEWEEADYLKGASSLLKYAAAQVLEYLRDFVMRMTASYPQKLKATPANSKLLSLPQVNTGDKSFEVANNLCVVVVGASTGGSTALEYLLKDLNTQQPTVVLAAVHMPEKFTRRLARRLQKITKWKVVEGEDGMELKAGTVVIAPGGTDMLVRKKPFYPYQLFLELEPAVALDSPSVDRLFETAASTAGHQVLGVILTGMGKDGTAGAQEIKRNGGVVIAQDKETSSIFGMAKSAIESGAVNGVFALGQINGIINKFVEDRNQRQALQTQVVG